jgi:hypothetical protein
MVASKSHCIAVIEDITTHRIAATGTLLIEDKFTHHCARVGYQLMRSSDSV